MYQKITNIAEKIFSKSQIFKFGFNWSPMYRRSTGKITHVSEDLLTVKVKIPLSWKNKNYMGSIFGGSLFSATDPIYMIQLVQILGKKYVVWDKSSSIRFRRPAYKNLFVEFTFTKNEIEKIKNDISLNKEIDYIKPLLIVDENNTVYCSLEKTLYIANKEYYKNKRALKNENKS